MTIHISPLPTEEPPAPDAGFGTLSTDRGNLPLDSVDVRAAIAGLTAGIEVTQGFRNTFDVPLEATYIFPLPDRAAVTAMRMEAADRVIEGTLKERGQARSDYDAAIAAGQRAAIAEEDRPDVFTMRVGNILPGERVTVRLTLDQPLPYETDAPGPGDDAPAGAGPAGAGTFRFPLVVAPRYIPGTPLGEPPAGDGVEPDTDAVPDASRISPPVLLPGFPNPVRLSMTVELDPAGLPLASVRSSLHVVVTETEGDRTVLRLQAGERLDRDFILRLDYAPDDDRTAASLAVTPDDEAGDGREGTFTLTLLPPTATRPRPRDVVLVLDRSGSMGGWKIVAARRAAARIVDTLTAADRFAVLSFDHIVERPRDLGTGLVDATDRNRFRAVEHLAGLPARGGTEMLAPLQEATALLGGSERDRVLVLITDGQVGNEDQILARLEPALGGTRIHAVGIDRAVNAGFLGRLAALGQGRFELVESEDRLDEAMEHIHHRIGSPSVTGLSLHWSGLDAVPESISPRRLGALFPGVPLVISGRYRGRDRTAGAVTVRGTTSAGKPWEQHAAGTPVPGRAGTRIWARAHLRDLEDRYAVGGTADLERRIVGTSLRFGVLCRFTAFVAVDSQVAHQAGAPHRVVQPVEQPAGWAGGPALPPSVAPMAAMAPPTAPPSAPMAQTLRTFAADAALPPPAAPRPAGPAGAGSGSPGRGHRRSRLQRRESEGLDDAVEFELSDSTDAAAGAAVVPSLDPMEVRQVRDELARLAALRDAPEPERWRHLSDLRTRLRALVSERESRGPAIRLPDPLTALVTDLEIADSPARWAGLDDLWERTVRVLTDLVPGETTAPPPPATPPPAARPDGGGRPFWKRRP